MISIDEVRKMTEERDFKRDLEEDKLIRENIDKIELLILSEAKNGKERHVQCYPSNRNYIGSIKEYFHSIGFTVFVDREVGLITIEW